LDEAEGGGGEGREGDAGETGGGAGFFGEGEDSVDSWVFVALWKSHLRILRFSISTFFGVAVVK